MKTFLKASILSGEQTLKDPAPYSAPKTASASADISVLMNAVSN